MSSAFLEQKLLSRIIKQAALEGSGEVITEALNILYDQGVRGQNTTAAKVIDRLAYSGVVGAAMGGGIQGAIEGVRSLVGSRKQAPVPVCAAQALERPAAATPFDLANRPQGARTPLANPAALPPSEVVRQQFLAERGLTEQADGSFITQDGVQLDPADGQTLSTFLAEADEAVADLETQDVLVTPDTVRRELQTRQRVRDLEAERATARTPEAQAVIEQQIADASQPAGGAAAELQTIADNAQQRGDKQTATAAQDAIKQLQEPTDGTVADRGSERGRAALGETKQMQDALDENPPEAKVRTVPPPLHPLWDRIWLWKVPPANKLAA